MGVPNLFGDQAGPINLIELDENFAYLLENPTFTGTITLDKNNLTSALTVTTPDSTNAAWDLSPLGAIHVAGPPTPTTRNFLAGIWVETHAASVDKGRGIMVNNYGASDGIYVQCDGVNGTGIAVLCTSAGTSVTGMVVGTQLASQVGVVLRQETFLLPTAAGTMLALEAEGTAGTEMMRVGSATKANQVGIIFRLFGANSQPIVVKDNLSNNVLAFDNAGSVVAWGNYTIMHNTTPNAGGTVAGGYLFSNVVNFGTFFGSGAPTIAAAKGSLYLRTDGTGINDRMYVNTNGGTTWTAVVTVA